MKPPTYLSHRVFQFIHSPTLYTLFEEHTANHRKHNTVRTHEHTPTHTHTSRMNAWRSGQVNISTCAPRSAHGPLAPHIPDPVGPTMRWRIIIATALRSELLFARSPTRTLTAYMCVSMMYTPTPPLPPVCRPASHHRTRATRHRERASHSHTYMYICV